MIKEELSIPEGYADLGDRQLNEILSNTRYHIRRRHAHDNVQDQFKVARAFESRTDVRDSPGGSRGRSVPAQPLTLPIPSRPKGTPTQRESIRTKRAPAHRSATCKGSSSHSILDGEPYDPVFDNLGSPGHGESSHPEDLNDYVILGIEHVDYYLAAGPSTT